MKTQNPIIWTHELAVATLALSRDETPQDPTRKELALDVRDRARELAQYRIGRELNDAGVEFVQCLRSRLNDNYLEFPTALDFERAWSEAWKLANPPALADPKEPDATLAKLGLTVAAEFVPFSRSRNAQEAKSASDLTLNWRVTIQAHGRDVLTTDYQEGIGHAPAHKASVRTFGHANSMMRFEALTFEAEKGREAPRTSIGIGGRALTPPSAADVLFSVTRDADALDAPGFETWADEFGYDQDSRKAEAIYRTCLDHGLKLKAAIGWEGLEQLRRAFADY